MFGSECNFLSNLSYIPLDEISFLKLILDSVVDYDNDNDNTFIEHKYRLQIRIYIKYGLLPIKCYVLYLCMETNNGSD